MSGTAWGVVGMTAFLMSGPVLLTVEAIRRRRKPKPRRPALGRVRVDPQYARDQFAEIVKRAPRELRRPDPRLYALYTIPPTEEG